MIWAIVILLGAVAGFVAGDTESRRRRDTEMSHLRMRLAQTELMLSRSRQHCKEQHHDLHVANIRIRHLQESNRHLTMKVVTSSAPHLFRHD